MACMTSSESLLHWRHYFPDRHAKLCLQAFHTLHARMVWRRNWLLCPAQPPTMRMVGVWRFGVVLKPVLRL